MCQSTTDAARAVAAYLSDYHAPLGLEYLQSLLALAAITSTASPTTKGTWNINYRVFVAPTEAHPLLSPLRALVAP